MRYHYEAIVVGSGIAGLTCAVYLKKAGIDIVVMTKNTSPSESNTFYAQGGIVAACPGDTGEKLEQDMLHAGCDYNRIDAVKMFAGEAPQLVIDFLIDEAGVNFNRTSDGELDYTGEAAHQVRRIAHYEDHTGDRIITDLLAYAKTLGIKIVTGYTAIDLITNNHHSTDTQELYKPREVLGLYALNNKTKEVDTFFSGSVVIATGGLGNIYQYTTNPVSATGDGISMAYRAGADIINAEFVQFHPTSLFHRDIKRFLISESLRGEGAIIKDHSGYEFMQDYSPLKDLAPRDVVSRAIFDRMSKTGCEYMFLDLANNYKGKVPIEERFSNTYRTCLKGGLDITREPVPVVPAEHYFCGGIKVDLDGSASISNLYAIGEASCTGIHGANRLASTSLLEGLLWGKKAAEAIATKRRQPDSKRTAGIPDWRDTARTEDIDPILVEQDMRALQSTMWNYAGIIRTQKGLKRALADLNYFSYRILRFYHQAKLNTRIIELRNASVCSSIIVDSALRNPKSIGCHYVQKKMG